MKMWLEDEIDRLESRKHCHVVAAAVIGAVAAVAGAGVAAYSAVQQGNAVAAADAHNQQLAEQQALIAQQQAEQDAQAQQRASRERIGAASAEYGASGVTSDGSPLDVLATSASQAELDRQTILYKGNLRALGYRDQSALDSAAAGQAKAGAAGRAGSEILTGASGAAKAGSGLLSSSNSGSGSGGSEVLN